jgi:hypothetical protein
VRTLVVFVAAPALDDDAGLAPRREPFGVEAFVAEFAIEALVRAVLPGLAGRDGRALDSLDAQSILHRLRDELGAVVGAQERRRSSSGNKPREHLDDALGADAAGDIDGEALARVLVDDGEALERLPVRAGVVHEIPRPDLIRRRAQRLDHLLFGEPALLHRTSKAADPLMLSVVRNSRGRSTAPCRRAKDSPGGLATRVGAILLAALLAGARCRRVPVATWTERAGR